MWFDIALIVILVFLVVKLNDIEKDTWAARASFEQLIERIEILTRAITQSNPRTNANEKLCLTPFVALINRHKPDRSEWTIENQGFGPAINVNLSFVSINSSPLYKSVPGSKCLISSLGTSCQLALQTNIINEIEMSLQRIVAVEAKARDLASEGYRYADLYGDIDSEFQIVIEYESLIHEKYRTKVTWSEGNMVTKFEAAIN